MGDAHRTTLVRRHQTFELEGYETRCTIRSITSDESSHSLGGGGAGAEVVIVVVDVVAAGVRGVGLPIVGRPSVAARAVEGQEWRSAGDAGIKINAVDIGRDWLGDGRVD